MLCDDCKKNEARVHFVVMNKDTTTEMNLCRDCAARYSKAMAAMSGGDYSVNDFIKGVIRHMPAPSEQVEEEQTTDDETVFICPNCAMSFRDFAKQAKIGCSVCYETFREELTPLLRRLHGAGKHRGKIPKRAGGTLELRQRIENLRALQERAVEKEEYEKAAKYRDEIRVLEVELLMQKQALQGDSNAVAEEKGGDA